MGSRLPELAPLSQRSKGARLKQTMAYLIAHLCAATHVGLIIAVCDSAIAAIPQTEGPC